MTGLVRICLRPKIFRSLDLERRLFGDCKNCVFGEDIGFNFESRNGPGDVRTRRKF